MLAALILLAVNLAWIWRMDQEDRASAQRMSESRNRLIETSRELYLMNRGWEYSIRSNGKRLPDTLRARPANGNPVSFEDLTRSGNRLVLVASDRNCSSCIDQLLFTVKELFPGGTRDNILVLFSSGESALEQWEYRESILDGARFLEIGPGGLNLPLDSLEIPYLFVTGPENIADLAFTPYPTLMLQTRQYLTTIKQRYFQNTDHEN